MKAYNELYGEEMEITVDFIFDEIKNYDELLVERDEGQAMWNISGPDRSDAEDIFKNIQDGSEIKVSAYYDEDGNNVSDDDEYVDIEDVLHIKSLDY